MALDVSFLSHELGLGETPILKGSGCLVVEVSHGGKTTATTCQRAFSVRFGRLSRLASWLNR
jgi:hypothetical protein